MSGCNTRYYNLILDVLVYGIYLFLLLNVNFYVDTCFAPSPQSRRLIFQLRDLVSNMNAPILIYNKKCLLMLKSSKVAFKILYIQLKMSSKL